MNYVLMAFFSLVTLFSLLFTVRRYRAAPSERRSLIAGAACGAVAVAAAIYFLIAYL